MRSAESNTQTFRNDENKEEGGNHIFLVGHLFFLIF